MSSTTIIEAQQILVKLGQERFFGTVSFQFKNGDVVLIRKEETILPSDTTGPYERSR